MVIHIADKRGITYDDVSALDEDAVYRMFCPDKHAVEILYRQPDYEYVHKELKRVGVTLKLLWQEYQDKCRAEGTSRWGTRSSAVDIVNLPS